MDLENYNYLKRLLRRNEISFLRRNTIKYLYKDICSQYENSSNPLYSKRHIINSMIMVDYITQMIHVNQYPIHELLCIMTVPFYAIGTIGSDKTPSDFHIKSCDYIMNNKRKFISKLGISESTLEIMYDTIMNVKVQDRKYQYKSSMMNGMYIDILYDAIHLSRLVDIKDTYDSIVKYYQLNYPNKNDINDKVKRRLINYFDEYKIRFTDVAYSDYISNKIREKDNFLLSVK